MNTIYMLGNSRNFPDELFTDSFATDAEGLERIALSHYCVSYSHVVVDLAAKVVRIVDEDGDVAHKYHIWTITRSV